MKLSVQKSAAKCLLLAIGLLHFNLVHCELARQSTLNLQSAEREWLPIPHTHDGTNTEGGGVRINRHTLQDPMEVGSTVNPHFTNLIFTQMVFY
jgi:hypothetical protein